ncbi:tRNA (adenine-N1)-methyltransferase [Candidatus Woesearchaeota archaeon]|nr:tRNA (adenine-N1)-methyltransferase [Candidatus Woesearchaeota archaeon]
MEIKRVLIGQEKEFFVKDLSKDFHTQFGFVKAKDLKKKSGKVKTNTGKEFSILESSFIDAYKKIKRDAQIMILKDIAQIIVETGINHKSKVVDAGAGSGALACFLAHHVKEIVTYEKRKDHIKVVERNIESFGLKNIKIKNKDVYNGIDEKNVDLVTLDLPEPWKAVKSASKALKNGGFVAAYVPTVPQVSDFVKEIEKNKGFVYLRTVEILEREWKIQGRIARPKNQMIAHTGFLVFVRKV